MGNNFGGLKGREYCQLMHQRMLSIVGTLGPFFFKTIVCVFNNDSLLHIRGVFKMVVGGHLSLVRKKKGIIYNARCSDCNAFPELYVTHGSALEVFEAASFDKRSPRCRFEGLSFCFCDFRSRLIKHVRASHNLSDRKSTQ